MNEYSKLSLGLIAYMAILLTVRVMLTNTVTTNDLELQIKQNKQEIVACNKSREYLFNALYREKIQENTK